MDDLDIIKIAIDLAKERHAGQLYNGKDYYESHLTMVAYRADIVANEFSTDKAFLEEVQVVAILHDILEDTNTTVDELRYLFSDSIVDAIVALTKIDVITDRLYFKNISENLMATIVKYSDRITNLLSLSRITDFDKSINLLKKYRNQLQFIELYFDSDFYKKIRYAFMDAQQDIYAALSELSSRVYYEKLPDMKDTL